MYFGGICLFSSGPMRQWQPETWQDSTPSSPPRSQAVFSTFWGDCHTKLHCEPWEKGKHPLENIQKNPVETAPRSCRFLSRVVVERVLIMNPLFSNQTLFLTIFKFGFASWKEGAAALRCADPAHSTAYYRREATVPNWPLALIGENQKGTAGRGREKKCHDNLRQTSRHFTTICDILWQFPSLWSIDIKRHKTS